MEKEVIRHIIEDLEISSGESQKERFFFTERQKRFRPSLYSRQ